MKLPDFSIVKELNDLRVAMGAEFAKWDSGKNWNSFDKFEFLKQLNEGKEVEIAFKQINIEPDGSFSYLGKKLLVYIRDSSGAYGDPKFHIADCSTLQDYRRNGFYGKYVVSTRTDGIFTLNRKNPWGGTYPQQKKLNVCKNCLNRLNYNNYSKLYGYEKNKIYENFNIAEFFGKYNKTDIVRPTHTNITSPDNTTYPKDWMQISSKIKRERGYKCEECGRTNISLEVHHKNAMKSDCRPENLIVLCGSCHRRKHR